MSDTSLSPQHSVLNPQSSPFIMGIRHHGPGSARSVQAALQAYAPDIVLIEGPPEADAQLALAAAPEMEPPVALLIYVPETPQRAVFYPFAEFSPEWRAIHYGLEHGLPVRFMDLPQTHWLALQAETDAHPTDTSPAAPPRDPLDALAQAAGSADGERWWEALIEERTAASGADDAGAVFAALVEAIAELRANQPEPRDPLEPLREAAMRGAIRQAQKEGFRQIAVICGAWHAPALATLPPATADRELLKGLPKVKIAATWVPWSYGHFTYASGYGAGVVSPGWYEHLWRAPEQATQLWLGRVARLLREADLDASAAQVIDAVRLAEALAALQERPRPGLPELNAAAQTVLCFGNSAPLQLIHRRLIVGDRLGQVPPDAPTVPLQADLEAAQRRLRLKPEPESKTYDLDLRKATDLERSALLHRLRLLDIPWGKLGRASGKGTFHEIWTLRWDPAFAVALVTAARWGNTLPAAATAIVAAQAGEASRLAALTALLDRLLLADLPEAIPPLMARLQAQAAISGDVAELLQALPPLAQAIRYGTVRQTSGAAALDLSALEDILGGLLARACIGLPLACSSLDDDAAKAMTQRFEAVCENLALLQRDDWLATWHETLVQLLDQAGLHGLVAGRCCRLLFNAGQLDSDALARRLQLALSPGVAPIAAAAWLEGLLRGSGLLLLHDETLWGLLDAWVAALSEANFIAALPLLRRTFAAFTAPERRQMGERVRGKAKPQAAAHTMGVDTSRADRVLPVIAQVLGLSEKC